MSTEIDYDKMTVYEKRVAVAKDVLERLDTKEYTAGIGRVFDRLLQCDLDVKGSEHMQAQPLIQGLKHCVVCAKGAFLLSTVRLFNSLSRAELSNGADTEVAANLPIMRELFGIGIMDEMEVIFEQTHYNWTSLSEDEEEVLWRSDGLNMIGQDARLRWICEKLIESGGEKIVLDYASTETRQTVPA